MTDHNQLREAVEDEDRYALENTLAALEGRHGDGWINITVRERRLFAKLLRAALATTPDPEQIADTPGAGLISEELTLRELGLLYNYREDDSRQFTRWQMIVAMSHGAALAPSDQAVMDTIERCAQAAENATLPDGYIWGRDALEQFDFGKERAAEAIRALGDDH